MTDDTGVINLHISTLRDKGVKIVELPQGLHDNQSLAPFLMLNDHGVLVIRNPKKETVPLITQIIKKGSFGANTKVNLTVWVIVDVTRWLDKLVVGDPLTNRRKKSVKDMLDKEYGASFSDLFDLAMDITQISNKDLIGNRYMHYLDNYVVDRLLQNL